MKDTDLNILKEKLHSDDQDEALNASDKLTEINSSESIAILIEFIL